MSDQMGRVDPNQQVVREQGMCGAYVDHEKNRVCILDPADHFHLSGGSMAEQLADNTTVLGALYQAAMQALDTAKWAQENVPGTNLLSDILLLERAVKMADNAAVHESSEVTPRSEGTA